MPSLRIVAVEGTAGEGASGSHSLPVFNVTPAPGLGGRTNTTVAGKGFNAWSSVTFPAPAYSGVSSGYAEGEIPTGWYWLNSANSGIQIKVGVGSTGFTFGPLKAAGTTIGSGSSVLGSSEKIWGLGSKTNSYGECYYMFYSSKNDIIGDGAKVYPLQYAFTFDGIESLITGDDPYGPAPGSAGSGSTPGGGGDAGAPNGFPDGTPSSTSDSKKDRGGLNSAIKAYRVSSGMLGSLASVFWGNSSGGLWSDLWQRFENYKFNPLSGIIACHSLPTGLVPTSGAIEHIFCAGTDLSQKNGGLIAPTISSQWTKWHSSPISLAGPYVNYADYSHSSVYIHLPFCGIVQVDVSAVMDGSIYVDYYCDVLTGNCAAWIIGTNFEGITQLLKCATGNCAYNVPLFGNDNGTGAKLNAALGFAQGMLSMGSQAAHGLISGGNFNGMPTNFDLAGNYLKTAAQVTTAQHHTECVGSLGGPVGFAGSTEVFLICDWPFPIETENYTTVRGRPSEVSGTVGSFSGYCELEVNPISIGGATDEEKEAIRKLCAAGVIV